MRPHTLGCAYPPSHLIQLLPQASLIQNGIEWRVFPQRDEAIPTIEWIADGETEVVLRPKGSPLPLGTSTSPNGFDRGRRPDFLLWVLPRDCVDETAAAPWIMQLALLPPVALVRFRCIVEKMTPLAQSPLLVRGMMQPTF